MSNPLWNEAEYKYIKVVNYVEDMFRGSVGSYALSLVGTEQEVTHANQI